MHDPDEHRTPWVGTVRLICAFEIQMDHEDDCLDAETAGQMARDQLRDALFAAATCKALSCNHRNVLATWQEIELVETEPENQV